ncbi:MAG: tRNA (N6-isopentenyl adenosine(37)-C2)-methylthiotransferase MiaB [Christensenellaceae bacterium]|nr:tRNA (N6-isopentenyl adenosine(37)-C2)-methylthiotransferase MiaB [Christensenellaceae bacterium]
MNVHESEKIAGVLENLGYKPSESKAAADLLLFNTCCVREHAEARLSGHIGALKDHKADKAYGVLAVCGCMMQQKDAAHKLMRRFPFVDMVFGTNSIHKLDSLLEDVLLRGQRAYCVEEDISIVEDIPVRRDGGPCAFVNIIYGCNNFCTYCIVPYVRGRERSRRADDIIDEIKRLCDEGVSEVTLLGQNVNSYGNDLVESISFPRLLRRIDAETNIRRIRFMTSHPKDMADELIACYGDLPSLCEHIHLPVQSGSDNVLRRMNRLYTRAHYLGLIDKLRARVPDIAITTDIIVGFPGETENDFEDTLSLVSEVQFDAAFTFAYSKRKLTKAADMPDQIDKAVKSERLARLNALVAELQRRSISAYRGRDVEVLTEGISERDANMVVGRTRTAKTVHFPGDASDIGRFINVHIDEVLTHTLRGKRL